MIPYNINAFAKATVILAVSTFLVLFFITQSIDNIQISKIWDNITVTITTNGILWLFFIKYAWKWKLFYGWLVPFPNLSGKWEAEMKSNWKNSSNKIIKAEVKIKQTFLHTSISITTNESKSKSIVASFNIDKSRDTEQLVYTYCNSPDMSVRKNSQIHYGSVILDFEGLKPNQMEGQYWTDRKTGGDITLKRKTTHS